MLPFFDATKTTGHSSSVADAIKLVSRKLSSVTDEADAADTVFWIKTKWLAEFSPEMAEKRRAAILARLQEDVSRLPAQTKSTLTLSAMLIEAIAVYCGLKPWQKEREAAAKGMAELFANGFDRPGNRTIYSSLHALNLLLKELNSDAMQSRKHAARFLFEHYKKFY